MLLLAIYIFQLNQIISFMYPSFSVYFIVVGDRCLPSPVGVESRVGFLAFSSVVMVYLAV